MSFKEITPSVFYQEGSVNIGYVHHGSTGLLIDSGLDESAVKKVLKEIRKRDLPLTHLFLTHAHADHYGGASYIQKNTKVTTIAPWLEEAIVRNPEIEPLYLLGGNDPISELKNKFLMGEPIKVDEVMTEGPVKVGEVTGEAFLLPGHSYHQLGLKVEGVLFAADSYFSEETLQKHGIPFITDAGKTLETLKRLKEIECNGMVPGHGSFAVNPIPTIEANISVHQGLLEFFRKRIEDHHDMSHEDLIQLACQSYGVKANGLGQWLLYRTAVTAYLLYLYKQGNIGMSVASGKWKFHSLR